MRRISDIEKIHRAQDVLGQFAAGTSYDDRIALLELATKSLKARKRNRARRGR